MGGTRCTSKEGKKATATVADFVAQFRDGMEDLIDHVLERGFEPPFNIALLSGSGTGLVYHYTQSATGGFKCRRVSDYGPPITLPAHVMRVDSLANRECMTIMVRAKGNVH